jgi:YHS domain-containing protein
VSRDPICNTEVDERTAEFKSEYGGQTYYFCSEECKAQFEFRPEQYARVACERSVESATCNRPRRSGNQGGYWIGKLANR